MSRITKTLASLKSQQRKALATYIVAGDPDLNATYELILALEKAGVTIVELGVPFSDPMADGPVIQKASERALQSGTTLNGIFDLVARVRQRSEIPILLMGYFNPVLQYGLKRFAKRAQEVGVDAALIVDLPVEESAEFNALLKERDLDQIFLITPTSDAKRVALICENARGFLYYVSLTGVTGAKHLDVADVKKHLHHVTNKTDLPILVGFGIATPDDVRQLAPLADGVVVGTALIKVWEAATPIERLAAASHFVHELTGSLKS